MDNLDDAGNTYLNDIISTHEEASNAIQRTVDEMASRAGPKPQDFVTREMVMLDTRNLSGCEKYPNKFTGPVQPTPVSSQVSSFPEPLA